MLKKYSRYFTQKNILLVLVVLTFFFALRWNHFTAPFERDEGVYAYSSWIARQGLDPYEYSFPYKPPMIIFTFLVSQLVFGDNVWGIRLLASLFSIATIIIVGLIAKHELGNRALWTSMLLLSVMLILPVNFGRGPLADIYYAANTEIFMLFPLVTVLYLFVRYKEKATLLVWFLAGGSAATAIFYKPICLILFLYLFTFWLYITWKSDKETKKLIFKLSASLFGALLTTGLILLPFLMHDGGKMLWNQMIGFTGCYKSMGNWDYGLGQFITRIFLMGKYYWAIYLLIIYYLYKRPKNWIFYSGLLLISYLSVYQSIIGHYYLLMMPALSLVSAFAITLLSKEKRIRNIPFWIFIFFILTTMLWSVRMLFTKSPEQLGVWVYGQYDPFIEARLVGEKINKMSSPEDYVYIEGMDPEILYFSQRKHAVKMEWTNFFSSDCPFLESYKKEYIDDLDKNKPKIISVCVSGSCSYIWHDEKAKGFMDHLSQLLVDEYVPVGGFIPKGDGGYWVDKVDSKNLNLFRTILYQRK